MSGARPAARRGRAPADAGAAAFGAAAFGAGEAGLRAHGARRGRSLAWG